MAQGAYVTGLRDSIRALERLGVDADELKDAMSAVAAEGAEVTAGFVPVKTGRLRETVRGNRAKARATVTVGRGKANNYAGVINYGWPERGIEPANFVEKTDIAFTDRAVDLIDQSVSDLIQRHGLA